MSSQKQKEHWYYLLLICVVGATSMTVQLSGTRILTPFFGASIYTWTSLIGTMLGFLSAGYFLGGNIADKQKNQNTISYIFAIAGGLNLVIALYGFHIAEYVSNIFPLPKYGTLATSIVLFGPVSIVFGASSPIFAKEYVRSMRHLGGNIAHLYGSSAIGSILGTYFTGYILLDVVSVRTIFWGVSLLFFIIAIRTYKFLKTIIFWTFAFAIILAHYQAYRYVSQLPLTRIQNAHVIDHIGSKYIDYYVTETHEGSNSFRLLQTDQYSAQSILDVKSPGIMQSPHLYIFAARGCFNLPQDNLLIGGGAFSLPIYYWEHYPNHVLDVVEIDPQLEKISQKYFGLRYEDKRGDIFFGDGRYYLKSSKKYYDAIFLDAFNTFVLPYHLITKEAMNLMYDRLKLDGILLVHVISATNQESVRFIDHVHKTMNEVFSTIITYQVNPSEPFEKTQQIVLVGVKGFPTEEPACKYLHHKYVFQTHRSAITLTDNFAPIENYAVSEVMKFAHDVY